MASEETPQDECLRTFVQISDLHFGDLDANGALVHPCCVRTLWTLCPFFTGLAGHEARALIDLSDFLTWMRRQDPHFAVLVTGDLTSTGKQAQFDTAVHFIEADLPSAPGGVGLQTGPWLDQAMRGMSTNSHLAIPGNHDHWPGRFPWFLGRPRSRMRAWARQLPFLQQATVALRGTQVHLRFLALNTDADVWGWGPERVLARGSFRSQLRRLEDALAALGPADPNEVRVLLCHHSLAYTDHPPYRAPTRLGRMWHWCWNRSRRAILEINKACRRELRRLLGQFDIPVLLTGHTHKVDVRRHFSLSPERRRPLPYLEACCGTTTQLNEAPSKWPSLVPNRKLASNFLLVHRLVAESRGIVWKTETWRRSHSTGFERAQGNAAGEPWASELLVWPRP
jgi:3',5'-cyclic AMP phosphodiesterase CpdA